MNTKDQSLLETWPKKQAKGKVQYMAYYALVYSIIVGIISLLLRANDSSVMEVIVSKEYLIKLAIFISIGLVIAHFKWNTNNRKYEELKHSSNQEV